MSQAKFSGEAAIKTGWHIALRNFWLFAGILVISFLISLIPDDSWNAFVGVSGKIFPREWGQDSFFNYMFERGVKTPANPVYVVTGTIAFILSLFVDMGLIKIPLMLLDEKKAKVRDIASTSPFFWRFLGGKLLFGLLIGVAALVLAAILWIGWLLIRQSEALLAIIGPVAILAALILLIIVAIRYQFYGYFIIDKEMGPIEALKKSGAVTKGSVWNLFIFGIALGIINLLGAIALLVGLFVTIPTTMVANAYVYRKLNEHPKKS